MLIPFDMLIILAAKTAGISSRTRELGFTQLCTKLWNDMDLCFIRSPHVLLLQHAAM